MKFNIETSILFVRFLTASSMNPTDLSAIVPSGFLEVDRRFRDAYCFHHFRPHDGGSKHP
jgi:hypothetical protein